MNFFSAIPDFFQRLLTGFGLPEAWANFLDQGLSLLVLVLIVWLLGRVVDLIVNHFFKGLVRITSTNLDDVLFDNKVFHKAVSILPPILLYVALPLALRNPEVIRVFRKGLDLYIILRFVLFVVSVTKSLSVVYSQKSRFTNKPVLVFFQVVNVAVYFIAGLLALSVLINQPMGTLIAGLGASMAIIVLVFKDTLLGFISGWQLTSNDLLRVGDWITVPKYGADGDVIEINLYSVKVCNFDKTITTIPPYALMSESFQNWRGMVDTGGRRIKRAVNIDMKTVRMCDEAMMARFSKIEIIRDYLDATQAQLDAYNSQRTTDYPEVPNVIRQTNLGVFRAYVTAYLKQHAQIKHDMITMVRQLQPTDRGLPLEVYCFVDGTQWVHYETVQSDIFDHILSVMPIFGLQVYQLPSSIVSSVPDPAERT